VQRISPAEVSPVSVKRSRLVVGLTLDLAVFLQQAALATQEQPAHPLIEFGLPLESSPARPSRRPGPDGTSHGLLLPTAHEGSEVRFTRAFQARHLPPSGFGYPLDGLLPPSPCRLCFNPTALMGFTLRSVPLPEGIPGVAADDEPTCCSSRRFTRCVTPSQHDGPQLLGFDPPASPWQPDMGLAHRLLDAPVGFPPSRAYRPETLPGSRPDSSHTLPEPTGASPHEPAASQSLNRPPPHPSLDRHRSLERRTSNPCRVPAPTTIPLIRKPRRPGYGFASRCATHCC
jgi:hypothetical protein